MQESIFNLFGSRHCTLQQHNSRKATSVSSSLGLAATANLKQKSLSVGGPTPLKRALGDVSNRPQQSRPPPGKEESLKPLSFSSQHKLPSLTNSSKTVSQKLCHKSDESGLKNLTPALKHLTLTAEVDCKLAVDWNVKPEFFPDPDITEVEDDYEDFFPKRERLTTENIRVITSLVKSEEPNHPNTPPGEISRQPLVDIAVEDMQSFQVDLLTGIADKQVYLPDLLWDIEDEIYTTEDLLRHNL